MQRGRGHGVLSDDMGIFHWTGGTAAPTYDWTSFDTYLAAIVRRIAWLAPMAISAVLGELGPESHGQDGRNRRFFSTMMKVIARTLGLATVVGATVLHGCSLAAPGIGTSPPPVPNKPTPIVVPLQAPGFKFAASPVTGKPFASQLSALGGRPPYRWAVSGGTLPAGWKLDPTGDWYGTTSATGSYAFNVTLMDADGTTLSGLNPVYGTLNASGTIPFVLGTVTLPTFGEDGNFGFEPFVEGGTPPYTFSVTGLPPGVTFDPSTGTLSGLPTASGSFSVVYTLQDSLGNVASNSPLSLPVSVEPPQPAGGSGSSSGGGSSSGSTCDCSCHCSDGTLCNGSIQCPANTPPCGCPALPPCDGKGGGC